MLSNKRDESVTTPALEMTGPVLGLVNVSTANAANAANISRDRASQRRQRRQRRQARAAQRMASGWSVGLW